MALHTDYHEGSKEVGDVWISVRAVSCFRGFDLVQEQVAIYLPAISLLGTLLTGLLPVTPRIADNPEKGSAHIHLRQATIVEES